MDDSLVVEIRRIVGDDRNGVAPPARLPVSTPELEPQRGISGRRSSDGTVQKPLKTGLVVVSGVWIWAKKEPEPLETQVRVVT